MLRTRATWPCALGEATTTPAGGQHRDSSEIHSASGGRTVEVQTAHTAELDTAALEAARALLDAVFEGDMSDHGWEHALGGVHALVWEEYEVVGHASVVQRRLLHGGRALRAGFIEGVGVRADRRLRGLGAA